MTEAVVGLRKERKVWNGHGERKFIGGKVGLLGAVECPREVYDNGFKENFPNNIQLPSFSHEEMIYLGSTKVEILLLA